MKEEKYETVKKQILATVHGEDNITAKMATISCLLKQSFDYFYWCGFYVVDNNKPEELVVGPYQGTMGCLRIPKGKGVCGTAFLEQTTQIVEDVHAIENHITCDVNSQSEIVVPVFFDGKIIAVLDVDSDKVSSFDDIDKKYLEEIIKEAF